MSVQGVDNKKAAVAIDSTGQAQEEASVATTQRKSMVRQSKVDDATYHAGASDDEADAVGNSAAETNANDEHDIAMMINIGCGKKERKVLVDGKPVQPICMDKLATRGTAHKRNKDTKPLKKMGVRCCKKGSKTKVQMKNYGCDKKEKTCRNCREKNYIEALEWCHKHELVLCSSTQLYRFECGTGCGLDKTQVWTSDKCKPTDPIHAPPALAESGGKESADLAAMEKDGDEDEEDDEDDEKDEEDDH